MSEIKVSKLLQEVGALLAEDTEYPLENTYLYAHLDESLVGPSIYKDIGTHVLYRDPDLDRLGDCLMDLWYAHPKNKRWRIMEYVIRGGRFSVSYTYPDELAKDWSWHDHRKQAVARHFGGRPVIYPPEPPTDFDEPAYTL